MPKPEIWLPVDSQRCSATIVINGRTHKCSNYKNHTGKHYDATTGHKFK